MTTNAENLMDIGRVQRARTAMPGGLHSRFFHAFIVFSLVKLSDDNSSSKVGRDVL